MKNQLTKKTATAASTMVVMLALGSAPALARGHHHHHHGYNWGEFNVLQDDTQELASKLAAGGSVYLDAGRTYVISKPITIRSNTNVTCSGGTATIKLSPYFQCSTAIVLGSDQGNNITNIVFDGSDVPSLTALVYLGSCQNVTLSGCQFRNMVAPSSSLVAMRGCGGISVSNSDFSNAVEGIFLYLSNHQVTLQNNTIHDVKNFGIRLQGNRTESCQHVEIIGNHIWNVRRDPGKTAGHLIYVNIGANVPNRHEYITVKDNNLQGINKSFRDLGNADLCEYQDVDHGTIEGNTAERGGDVGIAVVGSEDILVKGNRCGYNNTNGIDLQDSSHCTVTDNYVYDNNQNRNHLWNDRVLKGGIRVQHALAVSVGNKILNNHIYDDQGFRATQDYGIYVQGNAQDTEIGPNDIHDNKLGDVRDEGIRTIRNGG